MLEELVAQPHCIHVHVKSCNKICLNLSATLFFAYAKCWFSHDAAHILCSFVIAFNTDSVYPFEKG